MKTLDLEAKILSVVSRLKNGEMVEDSLLECKAEWPPPEKAARQIAGHSNQAAPERILWIIGLDERRRQVVDTKDFEFSNWWSKVESYFDGICPSTRVLVVPIDSSSVVGILIETERAPFVTKNPSYGNSGGGPVQWEVPWRDGNSTRTARRSDIIGMLAPITIHPEFELMQATFFVGEVNGRNVANFYSRIYMVPRSMDQVVLPFHKCTISAVIDGLEPFHLKPYLFMPCSQDGMDAKSKYRNRETSNEFILVEPGMVRFQASLSVSKLPETWGNQGLVKIRFFVVGSRHMVALDIPMKQKQDSLCAFEYYPTNA